MSRDFPGNLFYEYHKAFSARAAAALEQMNVKVDWSVRDMNIFCSVFAGHKTSACRLCGGFEHKSEFCPLLATSARKNSGAFNQVQSTKNPSFRSPHMNNSNGKVDSQGRRRITIDGGEICNNFNSIRGCNRASCPFLHVCSHCLINHPVGEGCPAQNRPAGQKASQMPAAAVPSSSSSNTPGPKSAKNTEPSKK